jgi:alcohol dehydrogenase class IV
MLIYSFPRRMVFGLNSIDNIADEVKALNAGKILLVTDPLIAKTDAFDRIKGKLEAAAISFILYDKVEPEPPLPLAEEVAEIARSRKFDAVLAVGGGSTMDTGKVAALSLTNPGRVESYIGMNLVKSRSAPLICAPTTSGSGSEVTQFAVLKVGEKKRSIISRNIVPESVILDPALAVSMPPKITANSGVDALSHAVEAVLSMDASPLTDALAFQAINLITRNIRITYREGSNIEARSAMHLAATISGIAFTNARVVVGHSISQTFAPIFGVPHGQSCAMALPYAMEFYLPTIPERLALIAIAMDEGAVGLEAEKAAKEAVRIVRKLVEDLNIPLSLKEVGVPEEKLSMLAELCVKDWPRPNSPRPLTKEAVLEVFERMWRGESLK